MAERKPLFIGPSGVPQELGETDTLPPGTKTIVLLNDADDEVGRIGVLSTQDGAYFARTTDGAFHDADGAIAAMLGGIDVYGATVRLLAQSHSEDAGRQLYVGKDGGVYSVRAPESGWTVGPTADSNDYTNLGSGTDTGPWIELVDTSLSPDETIEIGDFATAQARVYVSNTSGRLASIEVGYGVNHSEPAGAGDVFSLPGEINGYLPPISFTFQAAQQLQSTDTVSVWVRRSSGEHNNSQIDILGAIGGPAELILSTPSEAGAIQSATEAISIACSDEDTALEAGAAVATFRMPYAFALTAVRASVTTAPTGSTLTIDINESGTAILSTKLTIDATEKTSTTAATAAVISDSALADDAEITIDIDSVGSTVAGTGLKVTLIGNKT